MIRAALIAVAAYAVLSAHASAAPARLGVSATEFHLVLSRGSVRAGRVIVQLQNKGEDVHDLRLRRIGGKRTYAFPLTSPGRPRDADDQAAARPLPPLVLGREPRAARHAGRPPRPALTA